MLHGIYLLDILLIPWYIPWYIAKVVYTTFEVVYTHEATFQMVADKDANSYLLHQSR